jgi:hydroxymethylpyrimidine/phosphomethylpyrimidine kinase
MKQVLTIAGSDSGGGAGIQADLKAFHANGAFGMSVITSITAQNSREVRQAFDLPTDLIVAQINAIFDDFEVAAVKTGMLSSSAIVQAVSEQLARRQVANLVVDPVMISKSGFALLKPDALESVKDRLLPLATLVTPNIHEARLLADMEIETVDQAKEAARKIFDYGPRAVLVKGGHLEDHPQALDILFDGGEETLFAGERIDTQNTHGTGCTYSAAIAAGLANGKLLKEAVGSAKIYVTEAIRYSLSIGHGHGPTNHFYFLSKGH